MTACDVVIRLPVLGLAFISYVCDWMQAIVLPRSGFCFVKQENHLGGAAWLVSPTALIGEMFQSSSWQQSGNEDHVIERNWRAQGEGLWCRVRLGWFECYFCPIVLLYRTNGWAC